MKEEEEEEEVEEQRRGEEGLTQKMLRKIALYNKGTTKVHFTVKFLWSSEEEKKRPQKCSKNCTKSVGV